MLAFGKISKIDYKNGAADVVIEEKEGSILTDVPFLCDFYDFPDPGEKVAVITEKDRSVVLGRIFRGVPDGYQKGDTVKVFPDGETAGYRAETNGMEITADVSVKKLSAEEIDCPALMQEIRDMIGG